MTKKNILKVLWRFFAVFSCIFLSVVLVGGVAAQLVVAWGVDQEEKKVICEGGIRLNTNVPFIGNCIELRREWEAAGQVSDATTSVTPIDAFPTLIGGLTNILFSVILIVAFLMVVVAGVLIASGGADDGNVEKGKEMIGKVVIAIAALGLTWIILRLINPLFFQ